MSSFMERIESKSAVVALSVRATWACRWRWCSVKLGFGSSGSTSTRKRFDALTKGESYIRTIGPTRVAAATKTGRFSATF